jgi:hypothetical protein
MTEEQLTNTPTQQFIFYNIISLGQLATRLRKGPIPSIENFQFLKQQLLQIVQQVEIYLNQNP